MFILGNAIEEGDGERYFTCFVVQRGSLEDRAVLRIKARRLWQMRFEQRVFFRPDNVEMRDLYPDQRGVLIKVGQDAEKDKQHFQELVAKTVQEMSSASKT